MDKPLAIQLIFILNTLLYAPLNLKLKTFVPYMRLKTSGDGAFHCVTSEMWYNHPL